MANVSSSNGLEKHPKLRFKGFSEPWKVGTAEELFDNVVDKNHPEETVLTIIQGQGTLPREAAGRNIHYDTESLSGYKRVMKNDYVIHLRSFEGGLEIANSQGIVSPAYTILRSKQPCAPLFFDSYFHTDEFINHVLYKAVEGIRDGRQISYEAFKWLSIPYCSLEEQTQIAAFIEKINVRIEKQRSLVENLKKYKRGLLSAVFSRELSFSDGQWISKPFSEIAHLGKKRYTPSPNESKPCIELEHIEQLTGRLLGSVNSSEQNSQKSAFEKGDVLFGKLRPYLKKYALPDFEGVCSTEIWVFKPTECITSEFLYYLVQSEGFINAANISSGTKMPRAEWSKVASTVFFLPNIEDQTKIVNLLMKIDKKINTESMLLEKLEHFKKASLQKLFF